MVPSAGLRSVVLARAVSVAGASTTSATAPRPTVPSRGRSPPSPPEQPPSRTAVSARESTGGRKRSDATGACYFSINPRSIVMAEK